jgi:LPPG:FO 2-phospho-L-lactate transferase
MKVTALAGGVGGAKLLVGLARAVGEENLTAIVNTGDDAVIYGVHVSPDVDICTYWLAGIADTRRGWGITDDTFNFVEAMGLLGSENWFGLGDKDLATCLVRTQRLAEGATLTDATGEIARGLGVRARVLPMSDDTVRTRLRTTDGRWLDFQEYFVKERTAPDIDEVHLEGIEDAKPGPDVLDALHDCDALVICPSNPVLSIAPIIGLPGVTEALRAHDRVIAVTPIVKGAALKGPADRLLARLAGESSAGAVARSYASFCDLFVVDQTDSPEVDRVRSLGMNVVALDTVMVDHDAAARLAGELLETSAS